VLAEEYQLEMISKNAALGDGMRNLERWVMRKEKKDGGHGVLNSVPPHTPLELIDLLDPCRRCNHHLCIPRRQMLPLSWQVINKEAASSTPLFVCVLQHEVIQNQLLLVAKEVEEGFGALVAGGDPGQRSRIGDLEGRESTTLLGELVAGAGVGFLELNLVGEGVAKGRGVYSLEWNVSHPPWVSPTSGVGRFYVS
jgi:hypothetical protein